MCLFKGTPDHFAIKIAVCIFAPSFKLFKLFPLVVLHKEDKLVELFAEKMFIKTYATENRF